MSNRWGGLPEQRRVRGHGAARGRPGDTSLMKPRSDKLSVGIQPRVRAVAAVSVCLVVVGVAVIAWFAAWGVHGCSESVACFERMDRDFRVYLAGLGALGLGGILGGVTAIGAFRARRP